MATLTLNQVRKSFGSLEVLHGVDLSLEDGGFLVLLGPSGCGKSTLLSIIAGLEPLSGGEVQIGNRVVNDVHPKDRNIAMVFQSYALYPTMSVARNIGFGLEMRKIARAERELAIQKVAALLQVDHLLERKPGQLSGGQRQRVAMGRAIVRNPDLFLFDEPLSNLDAKLRVEMRTEIKRLHDRLGTTIVYVTHDQVEAMTLGTKVAVMKDGLIQQFDEPQAIYDHPANMFVAGFIGSPPMNFLPGTLEQGAGSLSLRLEGNGDPPLPIAEAPDGVQAWSGRPIIAGIRPEAILPGMEGRADFVGVVDVVEPTGPDTMVVVKIGEKSLTARLPPRIRPKPGEALPLRLEPGAMRFFDPASGDRIGPRG